MSVVQELTTLLRHWGFVFAAATALRKETWQGRLPSHAAGAGVGEPYPLQRPGFSWSEPSWRPLSKGGADQLCGVGVRGWRSIGRTGVE